MVEPDFSYLFKALNQLPKKHLIVANGVDIHSLETIAVVVKKGIVTVTVTGDKTLIEKKCSEINLSLKSFKLIHCNSEEEALQVAVAKAKAGQADIIMKGFTSTDTFMKAILNKDLGLLPKGNLLSHVTLLKNENYHKPLLVSDVAILPLPTLKQKIQQTKYLIDIAHKLAIKTPKVAFIAATEKVIERMPASTEAYELKKLWDKGEFPNSVCDGPMAFDVAVDIESARLKEIDSEVAGDADCLLFPNIESGNVFYKTNTKFCNASTAAIVVGTSIPTVLSSRGDSIQTKLNSIAFAAMLG